MSTTEKTLRAAFAWARQEINGVPPLSFAGALDFVPSAPVTVLDRTTDCPHLRWEGPCTHAPWEGAPRRITVSTSPRGRVLHIVDALVGHHSGTTSITLPRKFWPEAADR